MLLQVILLSFVYAIYKLFFETNHLPEVKVGKIIPV